MDDVTELVNSGQIDVALDSLNRTDISGNSRSLLQMSRIQRHKGKYNHAIQLARDARKIADIEKDLYISFFGQILEIVYLFGMQNSEHAMKRSQELDSALVDHGDVLADHLDLQAAYNYVKALILQFNGDLDEALDLYKKCNMEYCELTIPIDQNLVLYRIGSLLTNQGKLTEASEYFFRSIEMSESLNTWPNKASALTSYAQNLMYLNEQEVAAEYFSRSLEYWQKHPTPHGVIWALHGLGIVQYLRGELKESLNTLTGLFERYYSDIDETFKPSIFLEIIQIAVEDANLLLAKNYLKEFEELINQSSTKEIVSKYQLASSLVLKSEPRLKRKMEALAKFKALSDDVALDYNSKLVAMINYCDLLLYEFKFTEERLVETEAQEILAKILEKAQSMSSSLYYTQATLLRVKLSKLSDNPEDTRLLLEELSGNINSDDPNFWVKSLKLAYHEIFPKATEWAKNDSVTINPIIHSIPRLKILLYLLPRPSVSFSELEKRTEISSGNLNGQCKKLMDANYISKHKEFQSNRAVTIFNLTPEGFHELRSYLEMFSSYLKNLLN